MRSNTFTRTGYTFNGWNTKVDGSGTRYSDKATVKNLTSMSGGSITLYTVWKSNTPPTCTLAVSSSGIKFKTTSSDTISSWLSTKDNATSGKTSLELSEGTKYGFVKNSDGLVGKCSVDIEYSVRNKSYSCTESNYSNPKNSCSSSYPYYYSDTCDVTHKYTAELANCWYDEATRTSTWRSTKTNYLYNQTSCTVKATNGVTSCTYSQFQNNSTIVVGCKISSSTYSGVINCYNIYCSKGYTSISGANYCYK